MRTTILILFGIITISSSCEDKAGHHKVLSRPTGPDRRGINRADTSLDYHSEFRKDRIDLNDTNAKDAGAEERYTDSTRIIIIK